MGNWSPLEFGTWTRCFAWVSVLCFSRNTLRNKKKILKYPVVYVIEILFAK